MRLRHRLRYPRGMRVVLLVLMSIVGACTKDNPRACGTGDPCTDPAYPYCDQHGAVGGIPGACIAIDCVPGEFVACDGDQAVRCNEVGDSVDTVVCERGCDAAGVGCRLCEPSETACTNGITAVCDANGVVIEQTVCALGCFASEPRCSDVDPSNELAVYLDMSANAPDLVLTGDATISTATGNITNGDGAPIAVPSFVLTQVDGSSLRVFVVGSATIENLGFVGPVLDEEIASIALVADGDVTISGSIDLTPASSRIPPGSQLDGACVGAAGANSTTGGSLYVTGGGGGGGGISGGVGGAVVGQAAQPGSAGAGGAGPLLVPLVGGCAGGGGASGGGAIQIVSRTKIHLATGAVINAGGAGGVFQTGLIGGGGSGGGILLEAPVVVVDPAAGLVANGGSGATGASPGTGTAGGVTTSPAIAADCGSTSAQLCGVGGAGAARDVRAVNGDSLAFMPAVDQRAGGGGGAVGRIRINTADSTFTGANGATISPAPSVGVAATR